MKQFPIALQLFTIREALKKDYAGSLERVAEIGFKGVEFGRLLEGMTITELKALLDKYGLNAVGLHAGFDTLDFDIDAIADCQDELDSERFVSISLRFESRDDIRAKAKQLNLIGERFRKRGITFLYHNHDWEFERFGGEYALDILLRETDPELVQTELDTYWIAKGGEDPAKYLSKLKGRAPLLHIKDMEAGEEKFYAEIGEGDLDFTTIAKVAAEIGVQWMVVEQDQSRRDPFESLRISFDNLQRLGFMQT